MDFLNLYHESQQWICNILSHVKRVATLPCEISHSDWPTDQCFASSQTAISQLYTLNHLHSLTYAGMTQPVYIQNAVEVQRPSQNKYGMTGVLLFTHMILCLLWSPYVIGQTIIFLPCSFFLSSFFLLFFSSPNLSGRRLDVYHTLAHGVALVRI